MCHDSCDVMLTETASTAMASPSSRSRESLGLVLASTARLHLPRSRDHLDTLDGSGEPSGERGNEARGESCLEVACRLITLEVAGRLGPMVAADEIATSLGGEGEIATREESMAADSTACSHLCRSLRRIHLTVRG